MLAILLTSALGATACLGLGLVLRRSRRLGAADRHDTLLMGVLLALLMPALVALMPAAFRMPLPVALAPRVLLDERTPRGSQESADAPAALSVATTTAASSALPTSAIDAGSLVVALWALGALACAVRLAHAAWSAARIRRRAVPFRGATAAAVGPRVLVSDDVQVPLVTGVLRPVIVLPSDASGWSEEDVALTVLHERAHIARGDVPKQWVASILCTLHWFNPLAWVAARALATDREHAVDAMVLAGGGRPSSYAALLLRVAVRASETGILTPFHAPAVGRADLARRVEAVLGTPRARAPRYLRASIAGVLVLGAFAAACGLAPEPSTPPVAPSSATATAAAPPAMASTPSAVLLERALGGPSTVDPAKQAATEQALDALLADDANVTRALAVAMELPSGFVVAVAGRDRNAGPTMGIELAYPPASTVKPLVVAAALEAGVVQEHDTFDGQNGTRELFSKDGQRHTLTDVHPQGTMSLAKMLAVSSNIGESRVAERLGASKLVAGLTNAGLFEPVDGVPVAPALGPISDGDAWKQAMVSLGDDFRVNPLRVVAAYAALAGDGDVVTPRLRATTPRTTKHFVSPATSRAVRGMLDAVVAEGGTGVLAHVDGLRVEGKTGSGDLDDRTTYASFVGFFPAEAPRYVVLIGAETTDGNGGRTAAPTFAKLVRSAFR